ncbi:RagB/SusD family nutrient uptake outer membrane protein [Chitinophaga niabensis]|uniref:Starch-binding associating with outer membrane n=1 Tax=Chitinophaga niabensis TaxID=536979 RepID=A0A1N6DKK3_9BACT|nr:RagB/SusD family nutrient uptake outer membrane protein [Chitinophaga niabensis]SIN71298.1 Starch-binding associating with outer membrane [Chitinophaga niabensis]
MYKKILILLFLIVPAGCTKLEEEVFDIVQESDYQPGAGDIPSIMGPAYTVLRGMYAGWQGNFDLQEEPADMIVTPNRPNGWYDAGTYQIMHKHDWPANQWQPENVWQHAYSGINNVNRIIFQIEEGKIPVTAGKESLIAELRAARAFYYSVLVDTHGNVPIVTDFRDGSAPTQSTRQQVFDFIIKELNETMPLLSTEVSKLTYGRVNRWVAKAILARLYLNAQVYTGVTKWDECIAACDDIINSTKYTLEAAYKTNFITENQNSKETIFAVPYDEIFAAQNTIHMKTLATAHRNVLNMAAQPWGGNCAVPQFIDTYDADDTRLKDTWIMGPQYNVSSGALILTYRKEVPSLNGTDYFDGFRIGKYEIKPGARGGLSTDYVIFRYADIKMMKAECLLRKGLSGDAATLVTEIRQRAFASTNPAKATVTGAQLLQGSVYRYGYQELNGTISGLEGGADIQYGRFYDELGWEFAAEGHRRMDMIRFGVFARKTWFNHRPKNDGKTRTLFPIPQDEMDKNPNLIQNPDYR